MGIQHLMLAGFVGVYQGYEGPGAVVGLGKREPETGYPPQKIVVVVDLTIP